MRQTVYTCDGCGRVKQESNHWLHVEWGKGHGTYFHVTEWEPMSENTYTNHDLLDICGAECLHKKLNEFLQSRSTVTVTKEA